MIGSNIKYSTKIGLDGPYANESIMNKRIKTNYFRCDSEELG